MTPESTLVRALLLESSKRGLTLFRNQVGQYRIALPDCARCQRQGHILRSGLTVGSSDLIGWMPLLITPEHVGRTLGLFLGLEAKVRQPLSTQQRAFLAALTRAGGIARVVRSVEDLPTTSSGCV